MEAHMTKTKLNALLTTTAVLALAACGGSSTGGSGSSFQQLSTSGINLISQYGNAQATAPASMPVGTATYRGVAAYSTLYSNPVDIVQFAETLSEVELVANFDTSGLSGRAFNFRYIDPAITVSGELQVTGSISSNTFNANINGTLVESYQGASLPVNWNGSVTGDFVGNNADAIVGTGSAIGDAGIFGSVTANTVFGAAR
jgi:hypothetical protein